MIVHVRTARADTFVAGPHLGGPVLNYGKVRNDRTFRFGPKIEEPA
jgi:hypothetical protein